MTDFPSHPADQRPVIRELVNESEALRERRRQKYPKGTHPEGKRFTQEELRSHAYPSYKNLVQGRTGRLPSREEVLRIADYLECTLYERNILLEAAQYQPVQLELPADQHQSVLSDALAELYTLPFPAFVGTHGMVYRCNRHFLSLNGLSLENPLASSSCAILATTFDPSLQIRKRLSPSPTAWQENARTSVTLFQRSYRDFEREEWYQARLKKANDWPDFRRLWDANGAEACANQSKVIYTAAVGTEGKVIRMRGCLQIYGFVDPFIFVVKPIDKAGRRVFADLGIPVLENRCELAIRKYNHI